MKHNRRDFVKNFAATSVVSGLASPRNLVAGILTGLLNKAFAEDNGVASLNYVQLFIGGGIERWYFDGAHCPMGLEGTTTGTRYNKIKNYMEAGGKSYVNQLEYALTQEKVNGKCYLPYLWESQLPGDIGTVPMKQLAKHMLTIRGVDTGIGFDAHGNNQYAAENPFGYPVSMGGLAPMAKTYSIPFAYAGGMVIPPSSSGRAGIAIDTASISASLGMFNGTSGLLFNPSKTTPQEIRSLVDEFIGVMRNKVSPSKRKVAETILNDRRAALNMMDFTMSNLSSLNQQYAQAYATYNRVLGAVSRNHLEGRALVGLDDRPILNCKHESSLSDLVRQEFKDKFRTGPDAYFWNDTWQDLRSSIEGLHYEPMAQVFATIECYLRSNLTNSLNMAIGNMLGHLSTGWDVHYTGSNFRLIQHSKYYQALAAGLILLLDRLGTMTDTEGRIVGSRTLVHLRSEFDRSPLGDLGSNHNIRNCHESFFSNMITDGPVIIGNAKSNSEQGAVLAAANNRVVEYKHVYSSVQQVCGLTRDRNFEALLKREGDRIVPTTNECKNVA